MGIKVNLLPVKTSEPFSKRMLERIKAAPVKRWVDPLNSTIRGNANFWGELIPGSIWSGGMPVKGEDYPSVYFKDFVGRKIQEVQDLILHKLPLDDMKKYTSENERFQAANLIFECHRKVLANPVENSVKLTASGGLTSFIQYCSGKYRLETDKFIVNGEMTEEEKQQLEDIFSTEETKGDKAAIETLFKKTKEDERLGIIKSFMAETLDRNACLTAAYVDYPGALENLFKELHSRNYSVRFMRNFAFEKKPSKGFNGNRYAVSFIAPEGYVKTKDNMSEKQKILGTKKKEKKLRKNILDELKKLISESEEKLNRLIENYLKQTSQKTIYGYRNKSEHIAAQIDRFNKINQQIVVFALEQKIAGSEDLSSAGKAKMRIGVQDRHLTRLLADICAIITRENVDIRYLTVESMEEEAKSICTFTLTNASDGCPINQAKFEELKKGVMDLTGKILGKRSLIDNIIGPAMIPTSSSHTCGANRIARAVKKLIEAGLKADFLSPDSVYRLEVDMCNTFQLRAPGSGKGHYSDEAVIAGLLDIPHDSEALKKSLETLRLRNSNGKGLEIKLSANIGEGEGKSEQNVKIPFTYADLKNVDDRKLHVNTIRFHLYEKKKLDQKKEILHTFVGESTGGGAIEILKIFNENCSLRKQIGFEPIRGNTITYLTWLKENSLGQKIIDLLSGWGYGIVNYSEKPDKQFVFCLDKRLSEAEMQKILDTCGNPEQAFKLIEVETIGDPLLSFDTPFADFESLLRVSNSEGKTFSEMAVEYETRVKGKTPQDVMAEMESFWKIMSEAVEGGLKATEPIFRGENDFKIEGQANKINTHINSFPFDLETFVPVLQFVNELHEKDVSRLWAGWHSGSLTAEEQKKYDDWKFIITDPLMDAIFRKEEVKTVLREKFRTKTIDLNDFYIRHLYKTFTISWLQNPIVSSVFTKAITYAIAANEWNARREKIVAAPTAGACGVLPGVLKAMQETYLYKGEPIFDDKRITTALFTAGLVGLLFNDKLKMNGGNAGCQAEIGAATAMAAAAATDLLGGDSLDINNAVAIALKSYEGLVCTPVKGFVAYPCITRNGFAASSALTAATLAINGYNSALSPDAVLEGYVDVSDKMHRSLKETGTGGLAVSKEGVALGEKLIECQTCKQKC